MKMDVKMEPDVIAILAEIDRQAILLDLDGKRKLKESRRMRELHNATLAKFRNLKKRMDANGR
jgi:hypothetical protein